MTKWQALWKTMRPLNLLIMALTMIGMYGALFNQLDGIEVDHFLFGVLTLSIVLLGAGGNVINDIEDVVVDAINKPGKNQIGVSISRTRAMNWYFILTLTGLLMGLIVSTIQKDLLLYHRGYATRPWQILDVLSSACQQFFFLVQNNLPTFQL
mgnify:CR=1 FL=1